MNKSDKERLDEVEEILEILITMAGNLLTRGWDVKRFIKRKKEEHDKAIKERWEKEHE